jgi:hypothetical protein
MKPRPGGAFNAILLQITTIPYKSFLKSFGRESGKKVQNAEVTRDRGFPRSGML